MAKKSANQPRWPNTSTEQAKALVEAFHDDLRKIAVRLARHERAANVDHRHVDEAFDALVRLGLGRNVGWKRPELEVGAGSLIFGTAFSAPDVISLFFDGETAVEQGVCIGVFVAMLMIGVALAVHGWFRGRL